MDLKQAEEQDGKHTPRGAKMLVVLLILWEVYTLDYVGGVGAALLFAALLSPRRRTREAILHVQDELNDEESDVVLLNRLLDEREKECK